MESIWQDLRFTLRQLRKNKSFTLTAVLSLALGIAATTSVFSVVYGVLIDPYPYRDAKRMVHVQLQDKDGKGYGLLFNNGPELKELLQLKCVDEIFGELDSTATMTGSQFPVSVQLGEYTGNVFTYMGVPPALGRQFTPTDASDPQTARVAVLSNLFWKKQFGGSRDVLGKTVEIDRKLYTVIGVAAPRFTWGDSDVYVPYIPTADPHDYRNSFLKLKPGVTLEQAQAELEPLVLQFAQRDPKGYPPITKIKLVSLNELVLGEFQGSLLLLFGSVALLLFIGCANVSILLLARGTARMHEFALRSSIGASRARIVRQLLTESVLLSVMGAVLGVLLAFGGVKAITAGLPFYSFPHEAAIRVSMPVLAFSVFIALATGILFGISPALQLSRPNLNELIQAGTVRHSGGSGGRRMHRLLIAGQVALTLVLLTTAGAATRAFLTAYRIPLGIDAEKVSNLNLSLPRNLHPEWMERANKFEAIRDTVAKAPGVEEASIVNTWTPPMQAYTAPIEIESKQDLRGIQSQLVLSSPEVFRTLGIALLQGRIFTTAEMLRAGHIAVVNQAFVRKYLAGAEPIGQHVRTQGLTFDQPLFAFAPGNDGWFEIIGVVADARNNGAFRNASSNAMRKSIEPAVYLPYSVVLANGVSLMVRTSGDPNMAIRSAEQKLQTIDQDISIAGDHPLTWFLETMVWGQLRFVAALFGVFSALGLALAAAGLYSVVTYSVTQRNQEMGIRMALGAQRRDIVELVLRSAAGTVLVGVGIGLALSIALNRIVAHWVLSSSRDPLVLAGVSFLLLLIAVGACLWPARRAATVDPVQALRAE